MAAKLSQLAPTPSPDPDDLMYIVRPVEGAAGSKSITNNNLFSTITKNITDKAVRFDPPATTPQLSAAGQAALYYAQDQNRFLFSENGGDYIAIGDVRGPEPAQFINSSIPVFLGNDGKDITASPIGIFGNNIETSVSDPWSLGIGGTGILFNSTDPNSPGPLVHIRHVGRNVAGTFLQIGPLSSQGSTQSSGEDVQVDIEADYGQTGTAGSVGILITRHESSLGSGQHDFIRGVDVIPPIQGKIFNINRLGHFVSGNPSQFTGRFTAASAQSPNTQSFEAADLPQSTLVYKWPASDPLPGQVLIASPPVGGVVTLTWGNPPASPPPTGVLRAIGPINTKTIGNVAGVATDLHTVTIPPGTLQNGDYLRITMMGFLGANSDPKALTFQGTSIWYTTPVGLNAYQGWKFVVDIVQEDLSNVNVYQSMHIGGVAFDNNGGWLPGPNIVGGLVGRRDSRMGGINVNGVSLRMTGFGAAANDVVQNYSLLEVCNF